MTMMWTESLSSRLWYRLSRGICELYNIREMKGPRSGIGGGIHNRRLSRDGRHISGLEIGRGCTIYMGKDICISASSWR